MTTTFDYLTSRDDADGLIAEFGQDVNVRKTVNSGTVYAPTLTTTDYPTQAAKVEFTFKQIQTGNVLETDERWLVAAGPLTTLGVTNIVTPDSIVTGDGVVHPVLKADPLTPAGTVVMYDCHVRF